MIIRWVAVFLIASLVFHFAFRGLAMAQTLPCGARADIIERLEVKYGETRRGGGLVGPTVVIELYASAETGSWTLLRSATNGVSCVMAVGEGWQQDDPEEPSIEAQAWRPAR